MINLIVILLIVFFFLVDEMCNRDVDKCEDIVFKVKYVKLYFIVFFRSEFDVNIFLVLIFNDGVKIFIFGLGVY